MLSNNGIKSTISLVKYCACNQWTRMQKQKYLNHNIPAQLWWTCLRLGWCSSVWDWSTIWVGAAGWCWRAEKQGVFLDDHQQLSQDNVVDMLNKPTWSSYLRDSRWEPLRFCWAPCWTGRPSEGLPKLSGRNSVIRQVLVEKLIWISANETLNSLTAVIICWRQDWSPPCWLRERIRCYRDKRHLGFSFLHIKCTQLYCSH